MLHSARTLEETRAWLEERIRSGKAIAQLRFVRVLDVQMLEGSPPEDWARQRGEGGFGSTDRRNGESSV
jgi:dUTPase